MSGGISNFRFRQGGFRLARVTKRITDELRHLLARHTQRNGQLSMEHLLGALHIALIDEAELLAALDHPAALGAHVLDQLQKVGAGIVLEAVLIVLIEKTEIGVFIDLRGHLRDAVNERQRLLARDHRAHEHLAVHRREHLALAVNGRKRIVIAVLVHTGDLRRADLLHAADALVSIHDQLTNLVHLTILSSARPQKQTNRAAMRPHCGRKFAPLK